MTSRYHNKRRANMTQPPEKGHSVEIHVNTKPVEVQGPKLTGLEVKAAAIAQGVEIQEDFLLTLEAHEGKPAKIVVDDETVTVNKHSKFTANDGDDDS
jgi:hypothetical protein